MAQETLTQIQTHIEEIEKRIKTLSLAVTANAQISAIKTILEELKQLLVSYQTKLDEFVNMQQDNNTEVKTQINELENTLTSLQSQITALNIRVEEIEKNGVGGSGSGTETTNWYSEYTCPIYSAMQSVYESPSIFIYCEPTDKIKIKATFSGVSTIATSGWHSFVVNDVESKMTNFSFSTTISNTFEYEFFPTQKVNKIKFKAYYGTKSTIYNIQISAYGRNVCIMNRDQDLQYFMFNDTYYLTRYNSGGVELLEQSADNLDLGQTGTTFSKPSSVIYRYNEIIVPKVIQGETENQVALGEGYNVYLTSKNKGIQSGTVDFENLTLNITSSMSPYIYQRHTFNNFRGEAYQPDNCCITQNFEVYLMSNHSNKDGTLDVPQGKVPFLFGGNTISNAYDAVPVVDNGRKNGSGKALSHGIVVMDNQMNQTFYPFHKCDYCFELGIGRNATAFVDKSGAINIYINRFNEIHRFSFGVEMGTNKWILMERVKYPGITRYIRGYNGNIIVKRNGVYEITTDDALEQMSY